MGKIIFSLFILFSSLAWTEGNTRFLKFTQAKKILPQIYAGHETTIYCPCRYHGKKIDLKSCGFKSPKKSPRALRLEWEHVVDAHAFGQSFREWREGDRQCKKKGRACAEKNPEFSKMESDLYNLWPIVGELNGRRSDYSMAEISGPALSFGGCHAKIQNRKFEPEDQFKGEVARTYFYMDQTYPGHGIISDKNQKLFAAWNKLYPVSAWECERNQRIEKAQGNKNPIMLSACAGLKPNDPGGH